MSPKTKLGRNPFEKGGARKAERKAAPRTGHSAGAQSARKTSPRKKEPRAFRRTKRRGWLHFINDLAGYWLPRARACAYMRAVRVFSRMSA
ncbi:MAG: hypothetical protein HY075_12080 [Deltaproteobacteria bacterium]|nr:hypothetical protein [Deltaproteobacteria bacterium]